MSDLFRFLPADTASICCSLWRRSQFQDCLDYRNQRLWRIPFFGCVADKIEHHHWRFLGVIVLENVVLRFEAVQRFAIELLAQLGFKRLLQLHLETGVGLGDAINRVCYVNVWSVEQSLEGSIDCGLIIFAAFVAVPHRIRRNTQPPEDTGRPVNVGLAICGNNGDLVLFKILSKMPRRRQDSRPVTGPLDEYSDGGKKAFGYGCINDVKATPQAVSGEFATFLMGSIVKAAAVLNPQQSIIPNAAVGDYIDDAEVDEIKSGGGPKRVVIWGCVSYEVVFGVSRKTNFCYSGYFFEIDGKVQVGGNYANRHNDAT